ncbi:FBP domain-containing protein [Rhodococcus sp. SJ-2]
MLPVTERDIRSSFINCSKGDAKRLSVPADLDNLPWDDLDFLGWTDPSYPGRCYVVTEQGDRLVGVALRHESGGRRPAQMCSICQTTHPNGGVHLMAARKTGDDGRRGNTIGTYMCADLDCSLYARRKKTPSGGRLYRDDSPLDGRIERVRSNLDAFIARVGPY